MSEVMGTFGHMSVHAGPDAWVRCGTYTDGALPNLSVDGGGVTMTLYLAGEVMDAGHVRFARDLVTQVQRFAAECERLHTARAGLADGAA
jgi:hypothetical protein